MATRSSITRRAALTSIAAIPACGLAPIVPAMAEPVMTPDERIDAAVMEIVSALREKWPNCPVRIDDCDNRDNGMILILTHTGDDKADEVRHRKIGTARRAA